MSRQTLRFPLSELPAEPGETLMSFCCRASTDACIGWAAFQRVAFHVRHRFASVRPVELRYFDWEHLGEVLGVKAEEIFELSERSLYTSEGDPRELNVSRLWMAPWTRQRGYAVFSPAALMRGMYWRSAWLRPGHLLDLESGTLMLPQCACGTELADIDWVECSRWCPRCQTELLEISSAKPTGKLADFAERFTRFTEQVFAKKPVACYSEDFVLLSGIWQAVALLRSNEFSSDLVRQLVDDAGVGPYRMHVSSRKRTDPVEAAIRYVQIWAAAEFACRHRPEALRRFRNIYWTMTSHRGARPAVLKGLDEVARVLGYGPPPSRR